MVFVLREENSDEIISILLGNYISLFLYLAHIIDVAKLHAMCATRGYPNELEMYS